MCLVAFSYQTDLLRSQGYDLVLIANRDEYMSRPAQAAHFWSESPQVLAGRDIQAGGTWMGVSRDGRFALLTNYRDPSRFRKDAKSRGLLVSDFLKANVPARDYLQSVLEHASEYNDFNLLAGSADGIFNFSSMNSSGTAVQEIAPGIYGMSNHLFETPWPKVVRARQGLTAALSRKDQSQLKESLFAVLSDPTPALDEHLPETGVGIEKERALSSIFITMPGYGTRCSTLLLIKTNGEIEYSERTFQPDRTLPPTTVDFNWRRS
jgi:uncharacterized protein with NRDE domain